MEYTPNLPCPRLERASGPRQRSQEAEVRQPCLGYGVRSRVHMNTLIENYELHKKRIQTVKRVLYYTILHAKHTSSKVAAAAAAVIGYSLSYSVTGFDEPLIFLIE